ncbi:MAG TPA: AI-2E family transporter [Rhizobiaceae bacterium]|nr:AI-2E family transporter [Rhizobiaceae bacterium]
MTKDPPEQGPEGTRWLSAIHGHIRNISVGTSLAVVIGLIVFFYLVRSVLLPFVLAGIVAYVATPAVDCAARRWHLPRWLPALAVLVALVLLMAVIAYLGGPPLFDEAKSIGGDLKGSIADLLRNILQNRSFTLFGQQFNADKAADAVSKAIQQWMGNDVVTVASIAFVAFFGFILAWVLLGYFLFDAHRIGRGLQWLVPPRYRPFVARLLDRLNPVLRRYFIGIGLIVLYASCAAYVGLGLFLKLKHAAVLAILTGLLEVIPLVGPAASAVLAGLVAVKEAKGAGAIISYIIYAIALRISIDEFFGPIVLGRAAYVPPVLVIFCFLCGGLLFGVVGVILAVPVALTIREALATTYEIDRKDD